MKRTVLKVFSLVFALLTLTLSVVACGGGNGGSGYAFKAGSATLQIGMSADVVQQLGTPQNKNVTAACGGIPGEDIVYTFNGYRVKTTPAKNGDVICMIELTSDAIKTPEGLTIGSTKAQVTSAMGGSGNAVGSNLVYTKGDMKLQFLFSGDSVIGIQYMTK